MRIVKVGVLAPTNKGIPLGVQGENRATGVEFDTRPWFREYPYGTVSAVARRDGDPAPYPLSLDVADGTAVWQVSDTDTAKAGEGAVELTMTSAGARVRSLTFKTLVTASLTDAPVDDDAWYGWLDKAVVKVDETVQAAQRKIVEVDEEWTGLKADVTAKVDECAEVAAQAASEAHHAKVDAQATAKALESAEGSVAKAAGSATNAATSASESATSASNAADAASAASDSASAAEQSATDASSAKVAAQTAKAEAEAAKGEAATSASNAADAASAASGSASAAEQSATDASNAKVAAQTAKDGAETAASNAATSARNAESSATAAENSASDAAASVGAINIIAPKMVNNGATTSSLLSIAAGAGATANGVNAVAIGRNANVMSDGGVALGNATVVNTGTSVAIGEASVATKYNEVSFGNGSRTREITHVSEPSAPTSAATKKYTDDNDAKTLAEAKNYVDANTSNALVGTVSGKLLHVEDAWPGKPLGLTIDGAYKQDGTPSPENPVPITVIENPVLHVLGRNLIDLPDMTVPINDSNTTLFDCGLIPKGTVAYLSVVSSSNATSKYNDAATSGLSDGTNSVYSVAPHNVTKGLNRTKITPTFDATKHLRFFGYRQASPSFDLSNYQLEVGGYHDYSPYTETTISLTLPAEHPYLAALPDGTHDEIVVRDGRVSINCVLCSEVISDVNYIGNTESFQYVQVDAATGKPIDGDTNFICNRFIPGKKQAGHVYIAGGNSTKFFFCFPLGTFQDSSEAASWFASNQTTVVYTDGNGAKTSDLGKIDIPSLPETISNVWTEAELTTNMSMTYKRDINVAFENLVQAVVAAAAGE